MKIQPKDRKFIPIIIAFIAVGIVVLALLSFGEKGSQDSSSENAAGTAGGSSSMAMMEGMDHGSTHMSSADDSSATATTSVSIDNYAFMPQTIKVKVGETVTWTNMDSVQHNIVADTPSDDAPNGPLISRGETYRFTFKKAGTYAYHCDPHPYMKAKVIVTE